MPDASRLDALINQIFKVLDEERVSPEEGLMIAEEILISSVERLAKSKKISLEELQAKLAERFSPQYAQPKRMMIGSNRGWVGNPKTMTEDN